VKLALDLYLPAHNGQLAVGKHPTLLARTPYNKNGMAAEARWFAARGYAVAVNDVRGGMPRKANGVSSWTIPTTATTSFPGSVSSPGAAAGSALLAPAMWVERNMPWHARGRRAWLCMIPVDSVSNCGMAGIRHSGAFELRS